MPLRVHIGGEAILNKSRQSDCYCYMFESTCTWCLVTKMADFSGLRDKFRSKAFALRALEILS